MPRVAALAFALDRQLSPSEEDHIACGALHDLKFECSRPNGALRFGCFRVLVHVRRAIENAAVAC